MTDIVHIFDTKPNKILSKLFAKALSAERTDQIFSNFVKTYYGPRAYANAADCQDIDNELPFYEQDLESNTNALDKERYEYLRESFRINSKAWITFCDQHNDVNHNVEC